MRGGGGRRMQQDQEEAKPPTQESASTDMEMRLQALSLLNTCGLHDFLPHRNFTGYACIQILRPLVLQSDASLEHFFPKVPLLQDCLDQSRKPIDDRIWRRCRGEKH